MCVCCLASNLKSFVLISSRCWLSKQFSAWPLLAHARHFNGSNNFLTLSPLNARNFFGKHFELVLCSVYRIFFSIPRSLLCFKTTQFLQKETFQRWKLKQSVSRGTYSYSDCRKKETASLPDSKPTAQTIETYSIYFHHFIKYKFLLVQLMPLLRLLFSAYKFRQFLCLNHQSEMHSLYCISNDQRSRKSYSNNWLNHFHFRIF